MVVERVSVCPKRILDGQDTHVRAVTSRIFDWAVILLLFSMGYALAGIWCLTEASLIPRAINATMWLFSPTSDASVGWHGPETDSFG